MAAMAAPKCGCRFRCGRGARASRQMGVYRKILVALDGSGDARAALAHAVALARDQNARLTLMLVQVAIQPRAKVETPPRSPFDVPAQVLREAAESVPEDVAITTLLHRGRLPAPAILEVAAEGDYDLILMGAHGHGRLRRALLGSVSEGVLRDAKIPVMFLRGSSPQPRDV